MNTPTVPMINGQVDWPAYHTQRASEYRLIAKSWRETAKEQRDPDFEWFAIRRSVENDRFAEESEEQAKRQLKIKHENQ